MVGFDPKGDITAPGYVLYVWKNGNFEYPQDASASRRSEPGLEATMITAIVRFPLRPGTTLQDAKALFEASAPKYQGAAGLVRKYYLFGDDGTGGGAYLWESREAAE